LIGRHPCAKHLLTARVVAAKPSASYGRELRGCALGIVALSGFNAVVSVECTHDTLNIGGEKS
jgi:hypothetical protein